MIIVLRCTVPKMESHTLEILQQGVWASLTGGWFYDLRQNVFCNTFHLYLWLFLLCFPFILHLYFPSNVIIYSFYCGTIGILFTVLKLINHRLHKMFDTSECIEETVPGQDLPESQKKRLQASTTKTALEDEGIELQVLNNTKTADPGFSGSLNEQTDDDSIISLEIGARAASSTVDLKVDVHRKNSLESLEELPFKTVLDASTSYKEEEESSQKQSQIKTPDLVRSTFRCKYNQLNNTKLRSKVEEGIARVQDDDFALSQSDCHIAKLRKESIEDLSEGYKMSQSDCHISNLRQNSVEGNDDSNTGEWSPTIPKHFSSKDPSRRKHRRPFCKNLHSESQPNKNLVIEKNKSFDIGELASNGSCGVLTMSQNNTKEQIKNTGSLELPLKDVENTSSLDKGLLYWKQQNLDRVSADNFGQSQTIHTCDNQKVCSETCIHSSDTICTDNTTKRLNETSDLSDTKETTLELQDNELTNSTLYSQENKTKSDPSKEKSFLQIVEENFDWFSTEYQNENPETSNQSQGKSKDMGKYKSEEEIKDEDLIEDKRKSGLKFQIESDEDSSDNCGSRSPLLCRHGSLKKDSRSTPSFLCCDNQPKIPRTHSSEEKHPLGFSKIGRTLSVDENVVLSKKDKNIKKLEKNSLSSCLLTVYDDSEKLEKKEKSGSDVAIVEKPEEFTNRLGKSFVKRESFLHRNKKLSLPVVLNVSESDEELRKKDLKEKNEEDVFSSGNERVGLDWLFEHTESEAENDPGHRRAAESSQSKPTGSDVKNFQSQGAIPKTRTRHTDTFYGKRSHPKLSRKGGLKHRFYSDENGEPGTSRRANVKKKPVPERENGIIDEEDADILQDPEGKNLEEGQAQKGPNCRETYDSSSSSATELSSLLPLSSLLTSLNPPTSPLLTAFLTSRREVTRGNPPAVTGEEREKENQPTEAVESSNFPLSRSRPRRNKKHTRTQRPSRPNRVCSPPLQALTVMVRTSYGSHIATSFNDTSQGAVHCYLDEMGEWMFYTFDSRSRNLCSFPVPTLGTDSQSPSCSSPRTFRSPKKRKAHEYVNITFRNPLTDNGPAGRNSVCVPMMRPPYAANSRITTESYPSFMSSRSYEDSARAPPPQQSEVWPGNQRETESQSAEARNKTQKSSETWDSNINLVSNSNSENDSSLSLNSNALSPNSDANIARLTFASFVRERFLTTQRSVPHVNHTPNSSSVVLSISEFRHNDNNNNISNNNNNDENFGTNFFPEALLASTARPSFGLFANGVVERHRHRAVFHSSTFGQDTQLTLSFPPHRNERHERSERNERSERSERTERNEQEHEQNHSRLFDADDILGNFEMKNKPRHYYKLFYTPWNYMKIRFDRLELLALLDRNLTIFEIILSLFLSVAVSVCGIILLNYGFYQDLFAFLFCFSLAGCQYSLLKSVQPDATSPTHGYNRVVIYSRSVYFCVTSLLILLLSENLDKKLNYTFHFYNIHLTNNNLIRIVRDGLVNLLLFFPVLFTLGLFPQINTFCLYLLEQIDMHVFGGNAMSNLTGAVYCVFRSVMTIVFVYGFAYGALSEPKASQHILFSIFCGILISLSYHLSRSSSNPAILWDILKTHLIQNELEDKNSSKEFIHKKVKRSELDKSVDDSLKSEVNTKTDGDEKSEDRNSQNNLLLNSNPSSNEMLKTVDSTQLKSAFSDNFEDLGSGSELGGGKKEKDQDEFVDPLPGKLKQTVNARLKNDAIVCTFIALLVFGIHCSTVFTALQPDLNPILWGIAGFSGIVLHYIVPELRKHLPWLCWAKPILKCHEHGQFEVKDVARIMWYEETYVLLCFLERNILYPVLVLAALTYDGPKICNKLGVPLGALMTCICGLKVMRSAFSNTSQQYLIVIFSALLFEFDYYSYSETFLVDYFFIGIAFAKAYEFLLKIKFVVIYIAPWQVTWGSAFHAFAQPFSVPHSAMLFIQAAVSALLSAPLNPFLGSAIFLASYVRPIKFWERDYNTKRVDHSNTRLSSHLERNLGSDDNNLNSIFYEHLTRSLQHSLAGDLELGRWGPVYQGDCFVLASDYLNCLVHIIEIGNGLVTFQMRGLEFRGTYCQQREVEAISERVEEDDGCCCCEPGHVPHILSVNAAFSKRWLAWEVTASKYVLEGYSISDNSAASTLQAFDFRKVLVTYYVKSIIFYCIGSPKLQSWLTNPTILAALEPLSDRAFVDLDPVFNINIDQDFDIRAEGITRNSFCSVYLEWIQYCCSKRDKPIDKSLENSLITLCLALSLMGRRSLGAASHNTVSSVEFFLYGLHALFKGDFRITSIRDDWVFTDMEFLMKVVAPGVRMSLKLHQDHFMSPDEYQDPDALFDAISSHQENLVISHEGDPAWRSAVLSGTPSLLALRHVLDDGTDEYKIIMLNKRYLSFRVIKLNRECVRGLWAGQQQELVFLRNRNPERGSIQNAKQVLRNMINSSCDQPIGYPIYVSPLTTSYSDTNKQYTNIIGGPLSLQKMKTTALKIWRRIRQRCREGCSSGSAGNMDDGGYNFGHEGIYAMTNINVHSSHGHNTSGSQSMDSSQMQLSSSNRGGSLGRSSLGGRGSLPSVGKPSSTTLASLAGLLSSAELPKGESFLRERETSFTFIKERPAREERDSTKKQEERKEEREKRKEREKGSSVALADSFEEVKEKETNYQRVMIVDPNLVFDAINLGRRIDVLWPDENMRIKGGRSYWKDWLPDTGMEGQVVHRWIPNHRDPSKRSNVDKTILLIKIEDKYVPIAEAGVQDLGVEV